MRKICLIAAAGLLALVAACDKGPKTPAEGETAVAGVITPVPLPNGPNFPVPPATINGWIANSDTAAIRGHAWSLWQSMGSPSGQILNGQNLPIWDTWADTTVVFPQPQAQNASLTATDAAPKPSTDRKFLAPAQFHHTRDARLKALAAAVHANFPIAVDSKYDPQPPPSSVRNNPGRAAPAIPTPAAPA